jgi:hypothetical protein
VRSRSQTDGITASVVGLLILAGIGLTRLQGYLLFHSLAEMFGIIIAAGIFILAWHSRRIADIPFFLFLGVWGLCAAGIDLLHTLAFKGMGVFPGSTANLPTQLWIAARYVDSLSFLAAPFFIAHRPKPRVLLLCAVAVLAALLALIFATDLFPDSYIEGRGLTLFKKASEYLISGIFILAAALIVMRRRSFDPKIVRLLLAVLGLKALSELAFTLYVGVYDVFNLLGHLLRIVAASLVYLGIVSTGFEKPYSILFHDLKKREEELSGALSQVKTLRGLLPICVGCMKIRNDTGYWQQLEGYISAHSEAEFTHGLCPECARKLYPELMDPKETESG